MESQHAFLGLGAMGSSMARNLATQGSLAKPLLVWNRTYQKAVDFAASVGDSATTVEAVKDEVDAVKRAHIIWSCLHDEEAAKKVWQDAVANDAIQDSIIVECSTMDARAGQEISKLVEEAGGHFIAMPLVGPPEVARKGSLICITAGPADAVKAVEPFIEGVIGKHHIDLPGKPLAAALQLKLCHNVLALTVSQQLGEFYTLAEKCGVGADSGHALVEALFPNSFQTLLYSKRMLSGASFDAVRGPNDVSIMQHVASEVKAMADECGVTLESYELAANNLDHVKGRGDATALYGVVREKSGLPFDPKDSRG